MDKYREIVKAIKATLIKDGKIESSKKVKKIIDRYLDILMDNISHTLSYRSFDNSYFTMKIYPFAYISESIAKFGLYSNLNPNYIFKIHFHWNKMKDRGFSFKPMKKMNYMIKRKSLNTPYVYTLIDYHEKNII